LQKENYQNQNRRRVPLCPYLSQYGGAKSAAIYVPEIIHPKYVPYAKLRETGLNVLCSYMTCSCFPTKIVSPIS
jgi:hypothetical protein